MRVLIGTLYTGENEFEQCMQSIRDQTHEDWEHVVYKHLPNKEAHDRLYRTFMDRTGFDLYVKLDADMVFRSPESLETLVDLFREEPDLDHAILAVHDWASGTLIMGLHAFSDRAEWTASNENLFVDHSPEVPGKRLSTKEPPAPIVDHSPNPSPFQAFRFGVHRALKVVQRDRGKLDLFRSRMQWTLLGNIWDRFRETGIRRLGLVVLGAETVLENSVQRTSYATSNDHLRTRFEREYEQMPVDKMSAQLSPQWGSRRRREARYIRTIGVGRLFCSGAVDIPRRIASNLYHSIRRDTL
ncbi:hypothetical protein [Longibacter sp.]|uniref:hypothetical protein n=1 Tax=Longibacter sp. TaxID=2045415 RepID=UPI003EB7EC7A